MIIQYLSGLISYSTSKKTVDCRLPNFRVLSFRILPTAHFPSASPRVSASPCETNPVFSVLNSPQVLSVRNPPPSVLRAKLYGDSIR